MSFYLNIIRITFLLLISYLHYKIEHVIILFLNSFLSFLSSIFLEKYNTRETFSTVTDVRTNV